MIYTRRSMVKKTIASLLGLDALNTMYKTYTFENEAAKLHVRNYKYDEKAVVDYFSGNYGERAGRIASLAMSSYRNFKEGHPYNPLLYLAQIKAESGLGNPAMLISPVGAGGSTQVMPDTALREPFNLNVYIPPYYMNARLMHRRVAGVARQIAERVLDEPLRAGKYAYKELAKAPEIPRGLVEGIERELRRNRRTGENASSAKFRLEMLARERLQGSIAGGYRRYEDELGLRVYEHYKTGDVRRMRERRMNPLTLRPEKNLAEVDERFVDEIEVPKSYLEMQRLLEEWEDARAAIAAYHAGENAIPELGGVPDIDITKDYVSTILRDFNRFSNALSSARLKRRRFLFRPKRPE